MILRETGNLELTYTLSASLEIAAIPQGWLEEVKFLRLTKLHLLKHFISYEN